jgi:phosphohistidine phosphatase
MVKYMKKLYIVRHAKSSWSDGSLSDFDRPLNNRGESDAPLIGKVLKKAKVLPDLVISSPAKRAFSTAEIISDKIGYSKDKIVKEIDLYHAGPLDLISIINKVSNNVDSLMIFGHNPGFTYLINTLTNFSLPNLPTCGFAEIELFVDDWKEVSKDVGKVINYEYPKKYK